MPQPRFHLGSAAWLYWSVRLLVHFLRWFALTFGLTMSRPHEEPKHAVILVAVLLATGVALASAIWLLFTFLR
jgi:hypothetical protein